MGHFKLNTLLDTLELLKTNIEHIELESEEIGIDHALGRYTAEEITAVEDLPGFYRSAVDGFVVVAGDTFGASEEKRVVFNQVGQSEVGRECVTNLGPNECIYISAGAMMPPNGDAAVAVEDCEIVGPHEIAVSRPLSIGENIIRKGDDIRKGDMLLSRGTRIGPGEVGAVAGAGFSHVKVFRKLKAAVISTGEEIVKPFNTLLAPGQVRDVNSFALCAALKELGAAAINRGIVKDSSREMEEAVARSLEISDIIVISGGSAEGTMDRTLGLIKRIEGINILANGMAVHPGKDIIVAMLDSRIIFALPGNPESSLLMFNLLVKPAVFWLNKAEDKQIVINARCVKDYRPASGREEYLPVNLDRDEEKYIATPVGVGTGFVSSMARVDGYVKIRASEEGIREDQDIEVVLF